jgi:hypothetical protein
MRKKRGSGMKERFRVLSLTHAIIIAVTDKMRMFRGTTCFDDKKKAIPDSRGRQEKDPTE